MSGGFPDMSAALFLKKISQLAFAICEISAFIALYRLSVQILREHFQPLLAGRLLRMDY